MAEELILQGGTAEGVDYTNIQVTLVQSDKDYIVNTITDNLTSRLDIIQGLVQHNFQLSSQLYDSNGNLVSGKIKLYHNQVDCAAGLNSFAEYTISALYNSSGKMIDYKVIG